MDGLRHDTQRSYWIREPVAEGESGEIVDIGEGLGQMMTEVKIAYPLSDKTST